MHSGVDDAVVGLDVGVGLGHPAEAVEEETVGELHDVGLVDGRDAPASVAPGVLEGVARDARGGGLGDDLEGLDDARHDDVLEARVEVLGVLADDDEVHVLEAARDPGDVPDGAQVRVEVERLPQPHVDRREPLADRRSDGTLERDAVLPDRLENAGRQGIAFRSSRPRARRPPPRTESGAPAFSRIQRTASATSGPMPSPRMSDD